MRSNPEKLILIKYGELALKKGNRERFERKLLENIREKFKGYKGLEVIKTWGRIFLRFGEENAEDIMKGLGEVFGIVGFGIAYVTEKSIEAIVKASKLLSEEAIRNGKSSFKAEVRRIDKSFPQTSYDIACAIGDHILDSFKGACRVDVHNPDWCIYVEVRERVYVYADMQRGAGGLPVGTSGKGILLLSGGIDSPVAGYMMSKRGLSLDTIYFHSPPYTSPMALEKVKKLSAILKRYNNDIKLNVVPFTAIQERIKERAKSKDVTLLMRAAMVKIADRVAKRKSYACLITGESLGQVASQTPESIRFTDNMTDLPVFRPLIGLDKEEIIAMARRIGTFETSILPYEDCCTLFAPRHPTVRPRLEDISNAYSETNLEELIQSAEMEIDTLTI